ncbi:MAG: phosphoglucosamine mutase, partial [Chitinophagaceae bacterium]
MPLIKSISGIRGTIGDKPGENLTPEDIVKFTTAFARLLLEENPANKNKKPKMVIGRDGRTSGE